jgi:hypothetical protein
VPVRLRTEISRRAASTPAATTAPTGSITFRE